MSSYVGPTGRLYKRERPSGKWVAMTILALTLIVLILVGPRTMAAAFGYIGL